MTTPLSTAALSDFLGRYPPSRRYWVAFSGGLDSAVLLHLCHTLRSARPGFEVAAAHVHHGLHADADAWAAWCIEACTALAIPLTIRRVDARPAAGESPEEAARDARYVALEALLASGDTLLTAQHQDDQAETLLLQLLRGAGPAGLAAMPERAACGSGFLARPLLACRRAQLADYAGQHRLSWLEDPSNVDPRYRRNYLRREILPRLAHHWPGVAGTLARTAAHCAEADELLGGFAQELLEPLHDPLRNTLCAAGLRAQTPARQRLILRAWLRASGCASPATAVIAQVIGELLPARPDRQPVVRWAAGQIRRFRGALYLLRPFEALPRGAVVDWNGLHPLPLQPDNGVLRATLRRGPGLDPQRWRREPITIRYRQGGETLLLPNRNGTRELKKLLQQAGVAPWLRSRVPLVHLGDRLAAVGHLWSDAACAGDPHRENVQLAWEPPQLGFTAPAGRAAPPASSRDLGSGFE